MTAPAVGLEKVLAVTPLLVNVPNPSVNPSSKLPNTTVDPAASDAMPATLAAMARRNVPRRSIRPSTIVTPPVENPVAGYVSRRTVTTTAPITIKQSI
jgi:hypothetical protein